MEPQSTNHVLMFEPGCYYANPQTMETNHYQFDDAIDHARIFENAVSEFRHFRDELVKAGVNVTTMRGHEDCPDHVFCNWVSTYPNRKMVLYPMLAPNRRAERRPEILEVLGRSYDLVLDLRDEELKGHYLEATGSLVHDRAHQTVYAGQSARTSVELAARWCEAMGYKLVTFRTRNHTGNPIYHSDLVLWIGEDIAACCFDCMFEEDRDMVRQSLEATGRRIVSLSVTEQENYCGNALQLNTMSGKRILAMSSRAFASLSEDNRATLTAHFDDVVHAPLTTIERYGGGSARCMLTELF